MLRKKRFCEIHKIRYDSVFGVSPERSEFKAVAGFLFLGFNRIGVLDNIEACAVGVIFGISSVADNKYLYILIQTAASPEAVALITIYLIERLADRNAASFQLNMYKRQTVHEYGNIIPVVVLGSVGLVYHILIYDLQAVIVDITLVDKCNVLGSTIVAAKYLNIVFLYLTGLFDDMVIGISYGCAEKLLPLGV